MKCVPVLHWRRGNTEVSWAVFIPDDYEDTFIVYVQRSEMCPEWDGQAYYKRREMVCPNVDQLIADTRLVAEAERKKEL